MKVALTNGMFWLVVPALYLGIANLFANEVPAPYMDEIFHVPQCQAYCEGRFSYWDPMITTFPGLYYTALFLLSSLFPATFLLKLMQGESGQRAFKALCSLHALRFVNVVLSLVCLVLFQEIAAELRLRNERRLKVESGSQELGAARSKLTDQEMKQLDDFLSRANGQRPTGDSFLGSDEHNERNHNGLSATKKRGLKQSASINQNGKSITEAEVKQISIKSEEVETQPAYEQQKDIRESSHKALKSQRPELEDSLKAGALALYPPHFFFAFLFYTDVGSTAAVAAMYLAALKHKFWLAALLAVLAIFFRQTNAVWALFVTCTGATELLWPLPGSGVPSDWSDKRSLNKTETVSPLALWALAKRAWVQRATVLRTFGPLLSIIAGFIIFAVLNGGIVLGAKDAHQMSLHLPQFLYCLTFVFCALAPVQLLRGHVSHVSAYVIRRVRGSPRAALALLLAALAAVHWFTIEHPYLLADNRHYPFYLWRWVFKRHVAVKYLLVPLYLCAATSLVLSLATTQRPLWIFFYLAATFGVLAPAPLIEFRYFNVPFFLAALHVPMSSKRRRPTLLLQIVLFAVVDVAAVYLFLKRTFRWPQEDGVQRFMW